MIPKTYNEWLYCITEKCNVKLTPAYIKERLNSLNDENKQETLRIVELYGKNHLENLKLWFEQALLYKA